ncbi:hypothetical protein ACOMHN_047597 [Nucella lapillus]
MGNCSIRSLVTVKRSDRTAGMICHLSIVYLSVGAPAADREEARSEGETEEMESSQSDDSQRQPLPQQDQQRRGRPEERQATLSSSLRLQNPPRHRSETPKSPHSSEEFSPRM